MKSGSGKGDLRNVSQTDGNDGQYLRFILYLDGPLVWLADHSWMEDRSDRTIQPSGQNA